jgi:hypothetical protein
MAKSWTFRARLRSKLFALTVRAIEKKAIAHKVFNKVSEKATLLA